MRGIVFYLGLLTALILLVGALITYSVFDETDSDYDKDDVTYFFTDAPGYIEGKDTIVGEVFIIEKGDPLFNR